MTHTRVDEYEFHFQSYHNGMEREKMRVSAKQFLNRINVMVYEDGWFSRQRHRRLLATLSGRFNHKSARQMPRVSLNR